MKAYFEHHVHRELLHSQMMQEIIERLETACRRFFTRLAKRSPKFRKVWDFSSIVFNQGGYSLGGNVLTTNRIGMQFKFSLSRPYDWKVKTHTVKRNRLGECFIVMVLGKPLASIVSIIVATLSKLMPQIYDFLGIRTQVQSEDLN